MDSQHQHNHHIKALLRRYLQGEATKAERAAVEQWYTTLEDTSFRLTDDLAQKEQIRQSLLLALPTHIATQKPRTFILHRYAAVACIIISLGALWFFNRKQAVKLETGISAIKTAVLPDGSTVTLNAASSLVIPPDFGNKERRVILSGEAFFEVKPDPAHPFKVSHGSITTTVLGTSFNIRAYHQAKISVVTGRVQVATATAQYILQQQEILQQQPSGELLKGREDTASMAQWRSRMLDFNGYTIADMAAALQREYPVSIRLMATPADTAHYNITFHKENIDNILKVMSRLTGMSYQTVQGQIIIHTKTYASSMK